MDHAVNPQSDSPLFNRIPPEVRNEIFKLALTAYEDPKGRKYRVAAYHCRPGFTRASKIDTELLLTCRRVYWETCKLPASINEHTSWYGREPPGIKKNHLPIDNKPSSIIRRQGLRTVHIFAQQIWLEGDRFASFTGLWEYACPTTLIITLRHSDWWWWESEQPLTFDPKQEGKASIGKHSRPSDPFAPGSWGNQFRKIKGLRKLQLELETVDKKKPELDAIVDRAGGWEFTLGDERVLRLNKSKTRRTGWIGPWQGKLSFCLPAIPDCSDSQYLNHPAPHDRGGPEYEPEETTSSEESHSPNNRDTVDTTSVTEAMNPDCLQNAAAREMEAACESESARLRLRRTKLREAVGKLQAAGVAFDSMEPLGGRRAEKTSVYYVVHLTWET
ncbi:MAG: hypothetical protein LQ349_004965 [Xanthoria aureola]|nr:MAG: hypothetical protein LQ349_004965 [Xanthoria aureola]